MIFLFGAKPVKSESVCGRTVPYRRSMAPR